MIHVLHVYAHGLSLFVYFSIHPVPLYSLWYYNVVSLCYKFCDRVCDHPLSSYAFLHYSTYFVHDTECIHVQAVSCSASMNISLCRSCNLLTHTLFLAHTHTINNTRAPSKFHWVVEGTDREREKRMHNHYGLLIVIFPFIYSSINCMYMLVCTVNQGTALLLGLVCLIMLPCLVVNFG